MSYFKTCNIAWEHCCTAYMLHITHNWFDLDYLVCLCKFFLAAWFLEVERTKIRVWVVHYLLVPHTVSTSLKSFMWFRFLRFGGRIPVDYRYLNSTKKYFINTFFTMMIIFSTECITSGIMDIFSMFRNTIVWLHSMQNQSIWMTHRRPRKISELSDRFDETLCFWIFWWFCETTPFRKCGVLLETMFFLDIWQKPRRHLFDPLPPSRRARDTPKEI
jgi:hypothetical protein